MIFDDFNSDVTLTWEEGGITAPADIWVSCIVLALPEDIQKKILNLVIEEVRRRNSIVEEANENNL